MVDGAAGGDVEAEEVGVAEFEVGGGFGETDAADELAGGGVDEELGGGDVEVALLVGAEAVGDALDAGDEDAGVGGVAGAVEVEDADGAFVGGVDVEEAAVGGEGDAVGAGVHAGDDVQIAAGGEVEDAVEGEFAGIFLGAVGGVGEVDVVVAADGDVVGGIEALALEAFGEDFDFAIGGGAGDAAVGAFAGVEAAAGVEGVAVGAAGVFTEDGGGALGGGELEDPVGGDVREEEELAGPGGAFGEAIVGGDAFDAEFGEVLGGEEEGEGEEKGYLCDKIVLKSDSRVR